MGAASAVGAVVGGVGSLIGAGSSRSAARRSAKAADKQLELMEEQLRLAQEQIGLGDAVLSETMGKLRAIYSEAENLPTSADFSEAKEILQQALSTYGASEEYIRGMLEPFEEAESWFDQSRQDLTESKDLAMNYQQQLDKISTEYKDFASDLMQDWEDTFGSMRQNLTDYYNNLSPDQYAGRMKADINRELDRALKQFDEVAAQNGIYTSGMRQQAQKEMLFNKAQQSALADIQARDIVTQKQSQWYASMGEPSRSQALGVQQGALLNDAALTGQGYGAVIGAQNKLADQATDFGSLYKDKSKAMGVQAGLMGNLGSNRANVGNIYRGMAQFNAQLPYQRVGAMNSVAGQMSNVANIYGNFANAYMSAAGLYGDMANMYSKSAAGYGKSAGEQFGAGVNMLGSGLDDLFGGD